MGKFRKLLEGKPPEDLVDIALSVPLGLASFAYIAGYSIKRWEFSSGVLTKFKPAIPTISIGNLTLGGTGKTPFTIYLGGKLNSLGYKCAVLTRGYARKGTTPEPLVVSDGERILANPEKAGDEAFLLAASMANTPVIVGKNRRLSAVLAMDKFHPDLLLLDDGFQHWRLERDLDIVLWDASLIPSEMSLFPLGPLREPLKVLNRADVIIYTRPTSPEKLTVIRSQMQQWAGDKQEFVVDFKADSIVSLDGNSVLTPAEAIKENFYAFCGVARPQKFLHSLKQVKTNVIGETFFPDHYYYHEKDLQKMNHKAKVKGGTALITTEKDAVKLQNLPLEKYLPLYVLSLSVNFEPSQDEGRFWEWMKSTLPQK